MKPDRGFRDAFQFEATFQGIADKLQTPTAKLVGRRFEINMRRVADQLRFVIEVAWHCQLFQEFGQVGRYEVFGKMSPSDDELKDEAKSQEAFKQGMQGLGDYLNAFSQKTPQEQTLVKLQVAQNVENVIKMVPVATMYGIDALYFSMLLGCWTAFEVVASDLWEEFVNARPELALSEPGPGQERAKYELPIGALREWGFNLQGRMGALLRLSESFDTREKAKAAYLRMFPRREKDAILRIFDDEGIKALSIIRNLIVHRGGIADHRYAVHSAKLEDAPTLGDGDALILDGEMVAKFVTISSAQGVALLHFVDDWLRHNTGRPENGPQTESGTD
jgi:hypothetical protein